MFLGEARGCGRVRREYESRNIEVSSCEEEAVGRNYNEDRVCIIRNIVRPADKQPDEKWPQCSIFAVFDGHGGSACSDP